MTKVLSHRDPDGNFSFESLHQDIKTALSAISDLDQSPNMNVMTKLKEELSRLQANLQHYDHTEKQIGENNKADPLAWPPIELLEKSESRELKSIEKRMDNLEEDTNEIKMTFQLDRM